MFPIARNDDLLVSQFEDEVVVFDRRTERYHHLNPLAAFVWERCDGETDVEALTDAGSEAFDLESPRPMVEEALVELTEAGLLEEAPGEEQAPGGVTRRFALRKMAATGAAVVALPLVTTMAAPEPAAAKSPASGGDDWDDDDWDDDDWDWDDDDDGDWEDWKERWREWLERIFG